MCKTDYTIEDFVLDREFRNWVLRPSKGSNLFWEEYLKKHPHKREDILIARQLVMNMSRFSYQIEPNRKEDARQKIHKAIRDIGEESLEKKTIPIHSMGSLLKLNNQKKGIFELGQFQKIACILVLVFLSSFLLTQIFFPTDLKEALAEEVPLFEEHLAPPGVKSNLTLQDGSKVILNSGSQLKYVKNFEPHQRELELFGEAYFEVATHPERPFKVKTGNVTTRAIGTSFNIKAFQNEDIDIALVTGSVAVELEINSNESQVILRPGEKVNINQQNQQLIKGSFDTDTILAWTRKTIVFEQSTINSIVRTLENWYGVEIHLVNNPPKTMAISGKFQDQSLKNVLIGLSHSANFNFEINKDQIYITFHQ